MYSFDVHTPRESLALFSARKGKRLIDSFYDEGTLNPSHEHRNAVCQSDHALMSVACIRRIRCHRRSRKLARRRREASRLLELLLGAELVGVAAFLLALGLC
jgi:hypothetical protein